MIRSTSSASSPFAAYTSSSRSATCSTVGAEWTWSAWAESSIRVAPRDRVYGASHRGRRPGRAVTATRAGTFWSTSRRPIAAGSGHRRQVVQGDIAKGGQSLVPAAVEGALRQPVLGRHHSVGAADRRVGAGLLGAHQQPQVIACDAGPLGPE